ncbi:MAG: dihydroorotase [Kiritimatiellia bacterium]
MLEELLAKYADPVRYLVVPGGLRDVHVHFRDPGTPEAETRRTGARAAAAGGFTCVTTMPNTIPAGDSADWVREQADDRSLPVRILPAACISRGRLGRAVADLEALAAAGAAAFTDDGAFVDDAAVMEAAMFRAARLGKTVMQHAVVPALLGPGVIRDCPAARRFNLPAMPPAAEIEAVRRDISICRTTGCALHVQHVSCAGTVELIRAAQKEGLPVTGEATPHHLLLACEDIPGDDANWKMAPPLGTRADVKALRAGVLDGTLTAFATDHAPHSAAKKSGGFRTAANGIVGLETAVGATWQAMVVEEGMDEADWVARWTTGPARLLGAGILDPKLNFTIIDRQANARVDPAAFQTKSANQPFAGRRFAARPVLTVLNGKAVWDGHGVL